MQRPSFCIRIAQPLIPKASHSTVKGFVKLGKAIIKDLVTSSLSLIKAFYVISFHYNIHFFNNLFNGPAIDPYFFMNR